MSVIYSMNGITIVDCQWKSWKTFTLLMELYFHVMVNFYSFIVTTEHQSNVMIKYWSIVAAMEHDSNVMVNYYSL